MSNTNVCVLRHLGSQSPIGPFKAEMLADVRELVAGGMSQDAAWIQVAEARLADLVAERSRIEKIVADEYAKTPAGKKAAERQAQAQAAGAAQDSTQTNLRDVSRAMQSARELSAAVDTASADSETRARLLASEAQRLRDTASAAPTPGIAEHANTTAEMLQNRAEAIKQQKPATKTSGTVMGSRLLSAVNVSMRGIDPSLLPEVSFKVPSGRSTRRGTPIFIWRNPMIRGYGTLFREGGVKDPQRLAEMLEEAGYLAPGTVEADGVAAGERAKDLVRAALSHQETPTQDEQIAAARSAEDEAMAAADDGRSDPFAALTDDELAEGGYADASPAEQEAIASLLADAEALGLNTEALREDAARATEGASHAEYNAEVRRRVAQAVAAHRQAALGTDAAAAREGDAGSSETAQDQGGQGGGEGLTLPIGSKGILARELLEIPVTERQRRSHWGQYATGKYILTVQQFEGGPGSTVYSVAESRSGTLVATSISEVPSEMIESGEFAKIDSAARNLFERVKRAQEPDLLASHSQQDLEAKTDRESAAAKADAAEQKRLADKAKADAQRGEFALTGSDRPADVGAAAGQGGLFDAPQPAGEASTKIEDVGEKIGGSATSDVGENLRFNRRNVSRGGIGWDDVSSLSDALKVREVVKAKVWPKPDYAALVDGGMPPMVARAIKQVYDGIASAPQGTSDEALKLYIDTLSKVRAAIDSWATDDTVVAALAGEDYGFKSAGSAATLLRRIWPDVGMRFTRGTAAHDEALSIGGNRAVKAMQFDGRDLRKWRDEISDGWPAAKEAWERQGLSVHPKADALMVAEGTTYRDGKPQPIWSLRTAKDAYVGRFETREEADAARDRFGHAWAVLDKAGRIVGGADSEAAAKDVARGMVKRKRSGTGSADKGFALGDAQRVGEPRREAGDDISSQRLMDTFGFRGVNFGRKGYIGDELRQAYLNAAWDALHDLAELTGLPPQALSLNGELGLAFGAQGRGGNAAAHFVPGMNEINLTRDAGAGTLAHEWGHALDHWFAGLAGLTREKDPFLSDHVARGDKIRRSEPNPDRPGLMRMVEYERFAPDLRPEMLSAFKALHEAMNRRPVTAEMAQLRSRAGDARAVEMLDKWISHVRAAVKSKPPEVQAEFDALADKLRAGDLGDGYVRLHRASPLRKNVGDMAVLVRTKGDKAAGVDIASNWKGLDNAASYVSFRVERGEAGAEHVPQGETTSSTYANESLAADKKKAKAYWSTEHEKFARAFETWVSDKLKARAQANTFLSTGGERADDTTSERMPYPRDAEREAMAKAFDVLVGELKTRETETGVAMYSQGDGAGTSREALRQALESEFGPDTIDALERAGLLTISDRPLANMPADAAGATADGKIALFSGNIDPGSAAVAYHEALHATLRTTIGEDEYARLMARMTAIGSMARKGNTNISRFFAEAEQAIPKNTPAAIRAEELAAYAVERYQADRESVPAAIRRWVEDLIAAIRAGLARALRAANIAPALRLRLLADPAVLRKLARDGLRSMARGTQSGQAGISAAPAFSSAAQPALDESNALKALSANDEMFALPKSDKTTVEGIAADIDRKIKVTAHPSEGLDRYTLTMPDGTTAELFVRAPSPYGPHSYGSAIDDGEVTKPEIVRPGEDAFDMRDVEDVWINVSKLKPGGGGSKVYAIAGDFAHNTGRVFIGDPAGVSEAAMRRRAEAMLSSALRWGTTEHLAPHPRQVTGDRSIGVPPLRWVAGDDLGNIRRLIDLNLKALDNAFHDAKKIEFDVNSGQFVNAESHRPIGREALGRRIDQLRSRGAGPLADAFGGGKTIARGAVWRALLREAGGAGEGGALGRDGLLARLARLGSDPATAGGVARTGAQALRQRIQSEANARTATDEDIRYSIAGSIVGAVDRLARSAPVVGARRSYTAAQEQAMRNVGFHVEQTPLSERLRAIWQDAGKKLAQGLADQFAPVRELSKDAYALMRLSKGASGALDVLLHGGQLKLTNGVYDFDEANTGGVLEKLLLPLGGEHHDFLRWVAANRAERLMAEDREHLFTAEDIAALKSLDTGTTDFDYTLQHGQRAGTVTRDRTLIYPDAAKTFHEFNRNVLDMAEQSGLIDGEARQMWEHEFYVPFYRVDPEQGGVTGANVKSGVVRQQAFKALKGGREKLNTDLLDNTLMNWGHLLDAAAKNRAAKATLEAAESMGSAIPADESTARELARATGNRNGVVWFMDEGRQRFYLVEDPYLLTALNGLSFNGLRGPVMDAMGAFKRWLTIGVTASPFFKVRNLLRDSVQAIASGPLSYNPAANVAEGWKLTDPKSADYFRLMASGGTIHFGTMLEGSEAKRLQALVESGVDKATVLDSPGKVKAFYRQYVEPAITAYNELGNRGEAVNRASLYKQLRAQGVGHAEATLQARDLMDFSMQGAWGTIRFLTQVVPFMNARIQGLYKLGRAAKENPARFGAVLGATAAASLMLLAMYSDDDDWKKREDWDRNNYWWFKFGGTAFRIPKPFEIGAMATLAERGAELMLDEEMTSKRFREQVLTLLSDNLSMNPIPQLVRPMLDVYANKDAFTGRPVEPEGMRNLQPQYRYNAGTSMAARGISTAMNAVTNQVGIDGLSPLQVDQMLRGYFGWLGSFVVTAGDVLARPLMGQPDRPAPDYWKSATGNMVSNLDDASSRYVTQMYDQAQEIERAYATWRALLKEGKGEEAAAFAADNGADIARYKRIEAAKRSEAKLNDYRRRIEQNQSMDADAKRQAIRIIQQQQDRIARQVSGT